MSIRPGMVRCDAFGMNPLHKTQIFILCLISCLQTDGTHVVKIFSGELKHETGLW